MHHFGVVGLSNALAILEDRETGTLWDHITGEGLSGPLAGHQLEVWPVRMTTVAAALEEHKDITISVSEYRSWFRMWTLRLYPTMIHGKIWLPRLFHASMSAHIDPAA